MKIKQVVGVAGLKAGACALIMVGAGLVSRGFTNYNIYQHKKEILANDPLRYARVMNETANQDLFTQERYWHKELLEMKDSINAANVQRAYFEGLQAVDTININ